MFIIVIGTSILIFLDAGCEMYYALNIETSLVFAVVSSRWKSLYSIQQENMPTLYTST